MSFFISFFLGILVGELVAFASVYVFFSDKVANQAQQIIEALWEIRRALIDLRK